MSVAFRKEEDAEAEAAALPDRPISPHPNLVTYSGMAQLDAALAEARVAYTAAQASGEVQADRTAMARATRDLRYFSARRASAQPIDRDPDKAGVQFEDQVWVERDGESPQAFRIVGEDEADPKAGMISYASPLGRALLGREVGEVLMVVSRKVAITAAEPA